MKQVGPLTVELTVHTKWWFKLAVMVVWALLWLGLIRDADSAEHFGGRIPADERAAKWLVDHAMRLELTPCS